MIINVYFDKNIEDLNDYQKSLLDLISNSRKLIKDFLESLPTKPAINPANNLRIKMLVEQDLYEQLAHNEITQEQYNDFVSKLEEWEFFDFKPNQTIDIYLGKYATFNPKSNVTISNV